MNRGNRKALIYEDDQDRYQFLKLLGEARDEFGVLVLSTCLMGNHFHLKVTTPNANISAFMEAFEGRYASYYNWRHRLVGHVFQGRFTAVLIENDVHLLTAACYVFMNPIVAGLASRFEAWKWSSYAATVGLSAAPKYLSLEWVEGLCPASSLRESQKLFRQLMNEAQPVIAYLRDHDQEVTPETFKPVLRSYIGADRYRGPVPPLYRSLLRPTLAELFDPAADASCRNAAIVEAHLKFGYTFAEIASRTTLHAASVGRIYRARMMSSRCADDE